MGPEVSEHATEAAHHAGEAAQHAAHGVKGALSKKLGPMPVGGWLLALAGGVGIALYFRNKSAADSADLPDDTTFPDDFTVNGDGFDQADPGGTNPGVGGTGGTDQAGNPNTPGTPAHIHHSEAYKAKHAKTNAEWKHHTVLAMTAMGFGAAAMDNTLDHYLKGQRQGQAGELRLSAALARCGPPPNPPKHVPGPGTGKHEPNPGHGTRDTGGPHGHQTPGTKPEHHPSHSTIHPIGEPRQHKPKRHKHGVS